MRGTTRAKQLVTGVLAAEFPPYLERLRAEWALTEEELPNPVDYLPREPRALDRWPLLATTAASIPRLRRIDHGALDSVEYEFVHSLRTFVWIRDQEWDRTIAARDDMTSAALAFLLDRQALAPGATIEETTVSVQFSDVTAVKGDRFVAGAFVAYELRLAELVTREPSGTVAEAHVQVDTLPHPALD